MPYDIIDPRCGKPFIRYIGTTLPHTADSIARQDYIHLDGRSFADDPDETPTADITCGSCGERVGVDMFAIERVGKETVWDAWANPESWVKVEE